MEHPRKLAQLKQGQEQTFTTLQGGPLPFNKWTYNPYKWPCKWVTGVITVPMGVITPVINGSEAQDLALTLQWMGFDSSFRKGAFRISEAPVLRSLILRVDTLFFFVCVCVTDDFFVRSPYGSVKCEGYHEGLMFLRYDIILAAAFFLPVWFDKISTSKKRGEPKHQPQIKMLNTSKTSPSGHIDALLEGCEMVLPATKTGRFAKQIPSTLTLTLSNHWKCMVCLFHGIPP